MRNNNLPMKRVLPATLLVLLLGVAGMTKGYAFSFSAVCPSGQTLYYTITDNNNHFVSITFPGTATNQPWPSSYTKPSGNIVIPSSVAYNGITYTVKTIGTYAFAYCFDLTGSIDIPETIGSIGTYAFYVCRGITSLSTSAPSNISIGEYAFNSCSALTEVTIGEGVTSIGGYAFWSCPNLHTVHFNATHCNSMSTRTGTTSNYVYYSVFNAGTTYNQGLPIEILTIGDNVTVIPNSAFRNINIGTPITIPDATISVGSYAFYVCYQGPTLPIQILGDGLTYVGAYAFKGCSIESLIIPDSMTSIGESSFRECSISELTMSNFVTSIGNYAFQSCTILSELTLSNSLTAIGNFAFQYSSISEVSIPNTVSTIGEGAFFGCTNLSELTIGEGVTSIGGYAFWNCPNLTTVHFNATNCTTMYTRTGSSSNYMYYSVFNSGASNNGALPITTLSIGNNVTRIPNYAFRNIDTSSPIIIPETTSIIGSYSFYGGSTQYHPIQLTGNSLTSLGTYAFNKCSFGSLTIPNGLSSIPAYAFQDCLFTELNTGNSVTSIGNNAFQGSSISELTIGDAVTTLGEYSFQNCSIQNLIIGNSVATFGNYSFSGCHGFTELFIPETVTTIGNNTFQNCSNLMEVSIGNSVSTIGEGAFFGCTNLSELTIGEGVTSIGGYAFWNCPNLTTVHFNATNCTTMYTRTGTSSSNYVYYSVFSNSAPAITTLTIGDNVTRIPNYAFQNCSNITSALDLSECTYIGTNAFYGTAISQAVLGDFLTTIGASAFYGCSNLAALTIGENVTTIGEQAFWHCANLQTVYFNATNCTTMYTRTGTSTSNYQYYSVFTSGNNGYASAITRVVIGSNVQRIPDYAFKYSEDIYQRLVIPASVIYIGKEAFYDCSSIPQMVIQGNSLTSLGNAAFYGCSSIRNSLNLPNSLTAINQEAFSGCSNIPSLHFGNAVTSIGASAFLNCSSIAGVLTLPNTLISIGASAFSGCSSLSNALIIPNSVTSIGASAFYNCTNLTELTIGESVTSIGYYAFWGCPNLHYLYFNATNCTTMQTKIGAAYYSVFSSSTEEAEAEVPLYVVSFMDNVSRIPDYAFKNCPNMYGVVIPNSATYIGSYAFYNCGGYYLDLGDSLTTIGSYAFALSSNFEGDLIIPNTVTSLGAYAFYSCMGFDGSLIIGSGIQTIGQSTFNMCNNFSGALIIGRQVNSIGANAFNGCSGFSALISENPAPPTSYASSFTSMDFNMPVYVPYGTVVNYQTATGWNLFSNYMEQCVFDQLNNDHWSDAENWYAFELPGNNDVVCINSDCHLDIDAEVLHLYVYNTNNAITIDNGKTLSATYGIGTMQPSQLVIADGGQLVNNMGNTYGTVQKQINGYGTGNEGWYTIATPIYNGSPTSAITNGAYDLYSYDEPTHYWMNEKVATNNMTMLNSAQGYLYANQEDQTLEFVGELNASNKEVFIDLSRQNTELPGYNLVGNPFTNNVNVSDILLDGEPLSMYYKAIGGGNLVAFTDQDNEPIRPCEGFIVQTLNTYGYLSINDPWRGESNNGYVRLLLSMKDDSNLWIQTDRAYLRTNVGQPLKKATTMEKQGLLYFIDNGGGYAVATNHTNSDFMLLAFEPAMNGTYQIDASLLNANCGYLHLIDRISGDDIDLLKTPTYVFEGNTMDVRLRFALALSPEAIPDWNDVVLRDSPFVMPFHNQNNDQDATGNSVIYYTINASANPIEGGLVIGTGYFMEGETCNLTATANEGYSFTNWMKGDEIVSTEATYSFTVTEDASFVANFTESGVTQTTNLAQGWSWWSTYIEMNGNNGLQQLEQSLGHNGLMIKTQSPYVQNYYPSLGYDYWFGPLTNVGLTNEAGYQISLSNACQAVVSGAVADAATHPVTIAPGWNWIGYPVMTQQSLSTALANFTPAANDLIKGQNSSATYYANYGWFPTSFTLRPGQGYMYLSNATENKTLTYAVGRGDSELVEAAERMWKNNEHAFAGNLTVMAVVAIDGEEQQSEEIELGAFVGGECRGSAVLTYFEPTDRWYAMLTIAGEEGEEINFAVIDRRKGNTNARSTNRVVFVENAVVGNLDQPYEVNFTAADALRVYPNPVERNEAFTLDIPKNETVAEVLVCNALGDIVLHKEGKLDGQWISGIASSGVYTVKVVCKSGNAYVGRLIVK